MPGVIKRHNITGLAFPAEFPDFLSDLIGCRVNVERCYPFVPEAVSEDPGHPTD